MALPRTVSEADHIAILQDAVDRGARITSVVISPYGSDITFFNPVNGEFTNWRCGLPAALRARDLLGGG